MRSLLLLALAACNTSTSHDVTIVHDTPDEYVRVSPERLAFQREEEKLRDGKRIVVTALVAAPKVLWEDFEFAELKPGAREAPAPVSGFELATIWGTFHRAHEEPHDGYVVRWLEQITVDRYEPVTRPARSAVSATVVVHDDPEHVVLDGRYEHGEERSAFDETIWLSRCPTPPTDGPLRVDGWLFGKNGRGYGHTNQYRMLLVANACTAP